jgi:DNA-binding NarL/FixJ family response regulator
MRTEYEDGSMRSMRTEYEMEDRAGLEGLRVLVVSMLGGVIASPLTQVGADVAVARDSVDLARILSTRKRCDIAVVDLVWNSLKLEWSFDGLDVLATLTKQTHKSSRTLIAVHGLVQEWDYLEEAVGHELFSGVFVKASGFRALTEAIKRVAEGDCYWDPNFPLGLEQRLQPLTSISAFLSSSDVIAHVSGAIASGQARDWNQLAKLLSYSVHTVNKTTQRFADFLTSRGEVAEPSDVSQAVVFRWCGEHARYIISWCRRNGFTAYRRFNLPSKLGQDV